MQNDRPIDDVYMQRAIAEFQQLCEKYDLAGGCYFVNAQEMGFTYKCDTSWNAIVRDETTPLGMRVRVKESELGKDRAQQLMEGTVWVFGAMVNFGFQTQRWGKDLLNMLRKQGMQITHTLPKVPHLEGR